MVSAAGVAIDDWRMLKQLMTNPSGMSVVALEVGQCGLQVGHALQLAMQQAGYDISSQMLMGQAWT